MDSSSVKKKRSEEEPWTNRNVPSLIHLSLEERIRIVHYFGQFKRVKQMQRAWRQEFGTIPPTKSTFVRVNRQFEKTGSVESLTHFNTGRVPTVDPKHVAQFIRETLQKDPTRTNRSIADELGITVYNLKRIWKSQGIPTRAFALAEVTQLQTKLAELQKKLEILEGTRKETKKRKNKGEEIVAPKDAIVRVASTSAKSIQAKKIKFEFPLKAVQEQKRQKSATEQPILDDYGIDDISLDSSSEDEDFVMPSTSQPSLIDLEEVDEEMIDEMELQLHEVSQEHFDQMNEQVDDDDT